MRLVCDWSDAMRVRWFRYTVEMCMSRVASCKLLLLLVSQILVLLRTHLALWRPLQEVICGDVELQRPVVLVRLHRESSANREDGGNVTHHDETHRRQQQPRALWMRVTELHDMRVYGLQQVSMEGYSRCQLHGRLQIHPHRWQVQTVGSAHLTRDTRRHLEEKSIFVT